MPGASVASAGVPWGKANSNSAKYWTTFKDFRIVWHHAPGGFNYVDICCVITAVVRWLLNCVKDSFMRQWVKTQPEVKSFWPGLRTGRCASKDEGPSESREQIWLTRWRLIKLLGQRCVSSKWIHRTNFFDSFSKQTDQEPLHLWEILMSDGNCKCFSWERILSVNSDFQEGIWRLRKVIVEQFRIKMLEYSFCAVSPYESLCMGQRNITPLQMLKLKSRQVICVSVTV